MTLRANLLNRLVSLSSRLYEAPPRDGYLVADEIERVEVDIRAGRLDAARARLDALEST